MIRTFFALFLSAICLISCDKNDDLTPNPAFVAEANVGSSDDPIIDEEGEEDGENNDSTATQLHFEADINGVLTAFSKVDIFNFNSTNSKEIRIIGSKNSGNVFEKLTIHIVDEDIIQGDTLYFDGSGADTRGQYFTDNGTNFYTFFSDNGYVVFNKVTSLQYGATFKFKATHAISTSDTSIYITNGSFLINRY